MEPNAFERRSTPCAEFPNDNQGLHDGATWVCVELGREPACELPRPRALAQAIGEEPRDLEASPGPGRGPAADSPPEIVSLLTTCAPQPGSPDETPGSGPTRNASGDRLDTNIGDGVGDDPDADLLGDDPEPIEIVDELSFDGAITDLPAVSEASEFESAPALLDEFARLTSALRDVARSLGADDEAIACLDALFGHTRLDGIATERAAEALLAGGVIAPTATGIARSSGFTAKVVAWQGILRGESEDFSLSDGGALEPLDEWAADVLARVLGPPARADGIRRELRRRGIAAFGLVAAAA